MKKYVEITLLPDADIELYFLWEKLYQQLHLAFVEIADENGLINVGVSFPGYKNTEGKRWLGDKLRLFAESEQTLENLQLKRWLSRLDDYAHVKEIKNVPDAIQGYAFFKRLSDKSNTEKLARRRAKRLSVPYDEALAYFAIQDEKQRTQPKRRVNEYPFISMSSLSSDRKYPVTIVREETGSLVFGDGFSTYGLSVDRTFKKQDNAPRRDSSVPLF
jgi:CRISPR-associated endonuclease Csy4